ncbi:MULTISPECIES: hypothetical protein [unclassified Rathayibacter]|uniref:hypothetical protein n=1 Tax=unclassified Rathayibacter TaxID=2609250 RepID=UPI0011B03A88|nr:MULTISPECIES: hypothetical protein [unclassified Rathayibacter]
MSKPKDCIVDSAVRVAVTTPGSAVAGVATNEVKASTVPMSNARTDLLVPGKNISFFQRHL